MPMRAKSSLIGAARGGIGPRLITSSTEREKRMAAKRPGFGWECHVVVLIATTAV